MKFFELLAPATTNYEIVARRQYGLPGVICDQCGATWSQTGVAFPAVEVPENLDKRPYRALAPVAVHEFEKLAAQIRGLFPEDLAIRPGLGFGRLEGEVVLIDGSDLFWVDPWTLLARRSVGEVLVESLGLTVVPADLRAVGGDPGLVEVSISPAGFAEIEETGSCSRCGYVSAIRNGKLRILLRDESQLPAIFRLSNFPTIVVGSESFVALLRREGWTGVDTLEVELG